MDADVIVVACQRDRLGPVADSVDRERGTLHAIRGVGFGGVRGWSETKFCLISRPYLSCWGSLPLALGFELPRGSGYGFYVVAGCDGQNRLAARCPATTRPLIERCDWIAV